MKISDIVSKKGKEEKPEKEVIDNEAEKLEEQRREIEKQMMSRTVRENDQPVEELKLEPVPEPVPEQEPEFRPTESEEIKYPQQKEVVDIPIPEQQQPHLPPSVEYPIEESMELPKQFKLSVVLINGMKIPIVFKCHLMEIDGILKDMDDAIEYSKVITLGDFKIPGEKVLYIDLAGR